MPRALTAWRPTRATLPVVALAIVAIAVGTLAIGILEQATEIADASAVYIVAVVVVGWIGGTVAALGTAVTAFLVYDLLFTEPRFSLVVADPNELLNLVLVLIVALAVGRLAALGRERATEADRRAAEATGLFAISRLLATAEATEAVADPLVERIARETGLERVWIALGGGTPERILADTGAGQPPEAAIVTTLVRTPGDEPARWVRAHEPVARVAGRPDRGGRRPARPDRDRRNHVRVAVGRQAGELRAARSGGHTPALAGRGPDRAGAAARSAAPGGDQRRSRAPERRAEERAARFGLARPAHAAGQHPGDGRQPRRPRRRLDPATARAGPPSRSTPRRAGSIGWCAPCSTSAGSNPGPWSPMSRSTIRRISSTGRPTRQAHARPATDLDRARRGCAAPVRRTRSCSTPSSRTSSTTSPTTRRRRRPSRSARDAATRAGSCSPSRTAARASPTPTCHACSTSSSAVGRPGEGPRHGMGVGLSIVRGMTEVLGGTATARRSGLGGLAIDIDLPAAPDPPPEAGGS